MVIWKYSIDIQDIVRLNMPKNASILTVQMQANNPVLWALVDPEAETEIRKFRVIGTGHPIKEDMDDLCYLSTFQLKNLVFHVFEYL